jgi:hypothetical protein
MKNKKTIIRKVKPLNCMVKECGIEQVFEIGDRIEILNTITKNVYVTGVIQKNWKILKNDGTFHPYYNTLQSARVIK